MLDQLWHLCMGWVELLVPSSCQEKLLALLWGKDIRFWHYRETKDHVSVRVPKGALSLLSTACIPMEIGRYGGIPTLVGFCLARPGLALGTVLLVLWCLYAEHLVWRVEIDGCQTLSESAVQEILAAHGCGVGDYIPAIDCDALHATVKAEHPEIAWLSVYLHGNTASVQLRETKFPEVKEHTAGTYANVVAACAGEIVSVRVYEGEAVVVPGDVVLPGELLISGVVSMKNEGQSRLEYASGAVLAKVAYPIAIEVTPMQEMLTYTGAKRTHRTVTILGRTLRLYRDADIPYAEYDTAEAVDAIQLLGHIRLPVTITTVTYRETESRPIQRTPDEAVADALGKLRCAMDDALQKGELLERTVTTAIAEDGTVRIDCLLYLLEDIAKTKEFTVTEATPENPS